MKVIDLTQPWGDRMPTWPQFASIEVTDITTHHRDGKSTMLVKANMHTGTHVDAPSHYCETGKHLGEIPLHDLVGTGLVIDLRPVTDRWTLYRLDQVLAHTAEPIREGDIVILYTGWERYNWTQKTRDDVTYFDRHPGPHPEIIDYLVDRKVKWIGTDTASMDHALCTRVRMLRPDLVEEYEAITGRSIEETLPKKWFDGNHYKTARNNVPLVENLGGDLVLVAGRRVILGAFPWRWVGGEASICRVAAFLDDQVR